MLNIKSTVAITFLKIKSFIQTFLLSNANPIIEHPIPSIGITTSSTYENTSHLNNTPLASIANSPISEMMKMFREKWNKWGTRLTAEGQDKRLISAQKAETTPLAVDYENGTGEFSGSSGRYKTDLHTCTCRDFSIRHAPCKHIYRLAIELGLLEKAVETDKNKIRVPNIEGFSLKDTIKQLELTSIDAQLVFKNFLYECLYRGKNNFAFSSDRSTDELKMAGFIIQADNLKSLLSGFTRTEINAITKYNNIDGYKRNQKKETIIDFIVSNIDNALIKTAFSAKIVFTLNPYYRKNIRKTYSYLLRKFDWDEMLHEDVNSGLIQIPKGAHFTQMNGTLKLAFPDDEITELLNTYNCNRCK